MPDRIVYKIMSAAELQQMQRDGVFHGSPVDMADGYIHLSCGSQLAATLDKHFSGVDGLMLAAVDLSRLGDTVRWEPARGGQLFPHIHGRLPVGAVVSVATLERTSDGVVKLPTWDDYEAQDGLPDTSRGWAAWREIAVTDSIACRLALYDLPPYRRWPPSLANGRWI